MKNDTEKGYLKISVTEAGGTIPIKGALVVITEYGDDDGESGNVLYSLTTDNGGYTPTVALDAPVKSESMMPGAYQPYALYNINVVFDGYYPVESVGVPVIGREFADWNTLTASAVFLSYMPDGGMCS